MSPWNAGVIVSGAAVLFIRKSGGATEQRSDTYSGSTTGVCVFLFFVTILMCIVWNLYTKQR